MAHEADKWIASFWMHKTVKRVSSGTQGKVVETSFDSAGALRCRMLDSKGVSWWSEAALLLPIGITPEPPQDHVVITRIATEGSCSKIIEIVQRICPIYYFNHNGQIHFSTVKGITENDRQALENIIRGLFVLWGDE